MGLSKYEKLKLLVLWVRIGLRDFWAYRPYFLFRRRSKSVRGTA